MKKLYILILLVSLPLSLHAQTCPEAYKYKDRDYVNDKVDLVALVLKRMHTLALLCNQYDLRSQTQRSAMNYEYQALRNVITQIGNGPHPSSLNRRTIKFLDTLIDSSFLGLDSTRVDATTREEAIAKAYEAMEMNMNALVFIEKCF